jgi:hypothetical protein
MFDWKKEADETDKLIAALQRRGVPLPKGSHFWLNDMEEQSGTLEEIQLSTRDYFTPEGKYEANHLIRNDKRKNVEWWIKIVGQLGALVTGLLGALIGVLAVLKK